MQVLICSADSIYLKDIGRMSIVNFSLFDSEYERNDANKVYRLDKHCRELRRVDVSDSEYSELVLLARQRHVTRELGKTIETNGRLVYDRLKEKYPILR